MLAKVAPENDDDDDEDEDEGDEIVEAGQTGQKPMWFRKHELWGCCRMERLQIRRQYPPCMRLIELLHTLSQLVDAPRVPLKGTAVWDLTKVDRCGEAGVLA